MDNILLIKHGALGDIMLASAAFAAIRAHYPRARITALTTKAYADLLRESPYFDDVLVDSKPKPFNIGGVLQLRRRFAALRPDLVIDLQCSNRSSSYWWLMPRPTPQFCGVALFASHRYTDALRRTRHAYANLQKQLELLGITIAEKPDIRWLTADISAFGVTAPYALLVPGGAAHRPQKRWPHFAQLASLLAARGITPVLLGSAAEEKTLMAIQNSEPKCVNLQGKTSIADIATLGRAAAFSVGNDTGPMHIIAASGCASLVLFSSDSDPKRSAPLGAATLQRPHLSELSLDDVRKSLCLLDSEAAKALA